MWMGTRVFGYDQVLKPLVFICYREGGGDLIANLELLKTYVILDVKFHGHGAHVTDDLVVIDGGSVFGLVQGNDFAFDRVTLCVDFRLARRTQHDQRNEYGD